MSVPTTAAYLAPSACATYVATAVLKALRGSIPHFAVLKRLTSSDRRNNKSVARAHAHGTKKMFVMPLYALASSRRIVLLAHVIRQSPRMVADAVATMGRELAWLPLLQCVLRRQQLTASPTDSHSVLEEALARTVDLLIPSPHSPQTRYIPGEKEFWILAQLLPMRGFIVCATQWVHNLVVADEVQIVRWLRSRQPEKWWVGMLCRVMTSFATGSLQSPVCLLLARSWLAGPHGRCEVAIGAPGLHQLPIAQTAKTSKTALGQLVVCAIGASIASSTLRHYVLPRLTTVSQRILLWCFEEVEYVVMRRYADVARHFDDIDDSLLTADEWRAQNLRKESAQRAAVLRGIAMRATAWIITRIVLVHPLWSLVALTDAKAVLWATGLVPPTGGNPVCLTVVPIDASPVMLWIAWSYRQMSLEVAEIGEILAETSGTTTSLLGEGGVVRSVDLLAKRLTALHPLYYGWQWTLAASLVTLQFSTLGRVTQHHVL